MGIVRFVLKPKWWLWVCISHFLSSRKLLRSPTIQGFTFFPLLQYTCFFLAFYKEHFLHSNAWDYSNYKFITRHETGFKYAASRWKWLSLAWLQTRSYFYPCIFMNNSSRKLYFLPHINFYMFNILKAEKDRAEQLSTYQWLGQRECGK